MSQPLSTHCHFAAAAEVANCMSTSGCLVDKKQQQAFSTWMQWDTVEIGAQLFPGAPLMCGSGVPMLGACAWPGDPAKLPLRSRCIRWQPLRALAILLRHIAGIAANSSMTQLALVLIFLAAGCHLGLNAVLITVCLLAFPTVVFCLSFCTARPRSRLQVHTDRGCTIM